MVDTYGFDAGFVEKPQFMARDIFKKPILNSSLRNTLQNTAAGLHP